MKFEPGAHVGPYQILGELGQGGMATVYRAYQPALEREVAIKVLPEFLLEEPGFKARFHREAVAVARLQHPNILSVFDHGEQDGVTYIVSEYVEGGTLAARLGIPLQFDYCVRILRPIADALDYAHSEGVVHRDVKPSNILLDRRGVPILADFGLARMADARESGRLTETGTTVGTPTYMAPEQCAGDEAGPPADIYALAVIAFEMVTGRVPFTATTPLAVMSAHQLKAPPSPRKINPSLPFAVEAPLLAGLAKDPADRPATATDFVDALAMAVSSSPSHMSLTPAPIYPLSPPPPSQIPAAQSPPPPSQIPAAQSPPPPSQIPAAQPSPPPASVAWPEPPAPMSYVQAAGPPSPLPPTTAPPSQPHLSPPPPTVPPQPSYQAQPPSYSPPATYAPPQAPPAYGQYAPAGGSWRPAPAQKSKRRLWIAGGIVAALLILGGTAGGIAYLASNHPTPSPAALAVGDRCVVGTWVLQNAASKTTDSAGTTTMSGGSGAVQTISSDGTLVLDFSNSQPLIFVYSRAGQDSVRLKGIYKAHIHAGPNSSWAETELSSTVVQTATVNGKVQAPKAAVLTPTDNYNCTSAQLVLINVGETDTYGKG
jgi:serine/threonine protein kinase